MRIAIYAFDGVTTFHLAAPQMVFDEIGRLEIAGDWTTELWSIRPGSIRTAEGYSLGPVAGPDILDSADLVIIPAWPVDTPPITDELKTVIVGAHGRGAAIAGLCLGAFAVAGSGLLEGRSAVTHWQGMSLFAERHTDVHLDNNVLYIDHGDVLTAAGTASAIDASLHVVRKHLGAAVANRVARSLVVAPHREGGQAQYIERPLAESEATDPITGALQWALARLDQPLSVDEFAAQVNMSRRSFVRKFRQSTGTTPARWLVEQRLHHARALLETTEWDLDRIAGACGFGSSVTLRQNFVAEYATTPSAYRRRFTEHSG
ncbi:helix-turn-helix domain-containing protein [Mycobacterium sp. PS03-16]|uniref:GlxA family transcriptional regulator n=1 Tax=Mycobacterium sp. PS03-16 TaxID=2559611 RepID=UPI0010746BEE|nr:helix-turn-helix domain-containing protein [Mycobacterium sp. PS03-16]TFV56120.1 helix-turn-helix domain-containing protein [Mycobacterium sp. PS03-16]